MGELGAIELSRQRDISIQRDYYGASDESRELGSEDAADQEKP